MTTRSGARGPYAKTAGVRQRILEASMEAFAECGYRATTMKDVASRAEISERGLVHHFGSKAELLTAVLSVRDDEHAMLMISPSGTVESFASMLTLVADNIRRPPLVELYTALSSEAASVDHPAHDHYRNRYFALRRYFERAFTSLADQGELISGTEPATLAAQFIALIDGLQVQWLYDAKAVDVEGALSDFLTSVIPRYLELTSDSATRKRQTLND